MTTRTADLAEAGVSIWLDDLSRSRIESGSLARLITERNVVGVTTNPTIFESAITSGIGYEKAISDHAAAGSSVDDTIFALTTSDVRDACDVLQPVFVSSRGADGRVSIEVTPDVAHDPTATIAQAKKLHRAVARDNVLIKIPGTRAGLPAITETIAEGISVNVTLIFGLDRYADVIDAYIAGLQRAERRGIDLSTIHSVASFFVSRVDTEINRRLDAVESAYAARLKSQAGLANARLAYEMFQRKFDTEEAHRLLAAGAHVQRPLWASTGVKDPTLPDTLYVTELVAAGVVNTMPEPTLDAVYDHGEIRGDTVTGSYEDARGVIAALAGLGINLTEVTEHLEREGLEKFATSWRDLQNSVERALADRLETRP